MVSINLLPKEILEHQKMQQMLTFAILAISGLIFVSIIIYFSRVSVAYQYGVKIGKLEKELRSLENIVKQVKELEASKATLESRKQLVEQLFTSGLVYPKFMVDLVELIPEGIWIANLNTQSSRGEDRTITTIKVSMNCNSYDKFIIADFLSNLENSSKVDPASINLGPINISPSEKYDLHTFAMEFVYKVPPPN